MRLNSLCTIFLLSAVAFLTGCESLQQAGIVDKPTVRVAGLSFSSISANDLGVVIDLDVLNPNSFAVNLSGYDYAVKLSGKSLVSAGSSEPVRIASKSDSRVKIPVTIPFSVLNAVKNSVADKDTVLLDIDATAWLDLPVVGRTALPTSKQIELPVPKIPLVSVDGVSVQRVGLTNTDVNVKFQVNNPNRFALIIGDLVGGLTVNGQKWLDTQQGGQLRIAPGEAKSFTVPVRLSTLSLGSSALGMLNGGEPISYKFEGKMVLGSDTPLLKKLVLPFDVVGKMGGI